MDQPKQSDGAVMTDIEVREVQSSADKQAFIALGGLPYLHDKVAAPLPGFLEKERIDPKKNSFYARGDVLLLLALRGGKPVARMSAQVDRFQDATHHDQAGFFGMFESLGDDEAVVPMVERGLDWLKTHGCRVCRGPFSYNIYGDVSPGFVTEGFDVSPMAGVTHNPPSYPALFREGLRFRPVRAVEAWTITREQFREALVRKYLASNPLQKGLRVRPVKKNLTEYRRLFKGYNEIWKNNWGQHQLPRQRCDQLHKHDAAPFLDAKASLVCETDEGELVAFFLTFSNGLEVAAGQGGRTTARNVLRLVYNMVTGTWHGARLAIGGVREKFRTNNISTHLSFLHALTVFERGYQALEYSWCLEDNVVIAMAAALGGKRSKCFTIYGARDLECRHPPKR